MRHKWLRSLKTSVQSASTLRILTTVVQLSQTVHRNMSDATGLANVPLSTTVTLTASAAGMSHSDAQTATAFPKQTQRDLEKKMFSVDEDRGKTDRKLAELLISAALDSALLLGLPELKDSQLTSHNKRLTRLLENRRTMTTSMLRSPVS